MKQLFQPDLLPDQYIEPFNDNVIGDQTYFVAFDKKRKNGYVIDKRSKLFRMVKEINGKLWYCSAGMKLPRTKGTYPDLPTLANFHNKIVSTYLDDLDDEYNEVKVIADNLNFLKLGTGAKQPRKLIDLEEYGVQPWKKPFTDQSLDDVTWIDSKHREGYL